MHPGSEGDPLYPANSTGRLQTHQNWNLWPRVKAKCPTTFSAAGHYVDLDDILSQLPFLGGWAYSFEGTCWSLTV